MERLLQRQQICHLSPNKLLKGKSWKRESLNDQSSSNVLFSFSKIQPCGLNDLCVDSWLSSVHRYIIYILVKLNFPVKVKAA